MSTAFSFPLPDFGTTPPMPSLFDLANTVGDIPLSRIRFSPLPGTATKADLIRLMNEEGKHFELIHGTLIEKAMGWFEGVLAGWIVTHFNNYLNVNEIGVAFGDRSPIEFSPKLIYEPDCGFVSSTRFPGGVVPDDQPVVDVIPTLAVEVISASNTRKEMEKKLAAYFECGVEEVWYVYRKTLQVFQFVPGNEPKVLNVEDTLTTSHLPGFSLPVRTLFSPPGRRLK